MAQVLRLTRPCKKKSADVRFPDSGTKGKNARRMSNLDVGLVSSSGSDETNDNLECLAEIGTQFSA